MHYLKTMISGRAGGISARGQIYMRTPVGVVEIHFQLELATPSFAPQLIMISKGRHLILQFCKTFT